MKPLIIMFLVIAVCGCSTGGKKNEGNRKPLTVDITDGQSFSEQAVFPDYRFIKLETTDHSSVGNAPGSVFYVMTMSRLFKYWEEHPVSSDAPDGMKKLRQACTNEEDNPVIIVCNYE